MNDPAASRGEWTFALGGKIKKPGLLEGRVLPAVTKGGNENLFRTLSTSLLSGDLFFPPLFTVRRASRHRTG